jgi:lipoprotein-releasing system ATP-binding protein
VLTEATRVIRSAEPGPSGSAAGRLLQAQNVQRFLGIGEARTHILRGVDLTIGHGEYMAIVGPSGSGKSTLLYLLGGLDRPTRTDEAGKLFTPESAIFIDGANTHELNDTQLALVRNEKIGFVFQFHYLLKEFTAAENVALPMFKLGRLSRDDAMERAVGLLRQFGLAEKARRRANRLSGGEQQRVAIARALANEPAVLLADEPTGNLDKRNSEIVGEIFQELAVKQTIVMVTHDLSFARRTRRTVSMEDGRVISDTAGFSSPV